MHIAAQIRITGPGNLQADLAKSGPSTAQGTPGQPTTLAALSDVNPISHYEDSPQVSKRKTIYKKDMSMTQSVKSIKDQN